MKKKAIDFLFYFLKHIVWAYRKCCEALAPLCLCVENFPKDKVSIQNLVVFVSHLEAFF